MINGEDVGVLGGGGLGCLWVGLGVWGGFEEFSGGWVEGGGGTGF